MVLKTRIRSLPPSAMNRRFPSESANRGKLSVASHESGYVGLLLLSVPLETVQRTGVSGAIEPSVVVGCVNELFSTALTRSGCPTAIFAAAPFVVGMLFQMST